MAHYHIIMNRKAGSAGAQQRHAIKEAFNALGVDYQLTATAGDIVAAAHQAAAHCQVLIAAGGDGTVGAVASVAVATNKPLGVIPAGTLNHFAKDASLPLDIAKAAAVITAGHLSHIDYATAGDRLFLNNASLGVYPKLVRRREQQEAALGKWPALAQEVIALLRQPLRRRKFTLTYNGSTHRVSSPFIFIGNNNYHSSNSEFGSRTRLDGGKLTLFVYTHTSWLKFGVELVKAFRGKPTHPAMLTAHPTQIIVNTSSATTEIATDGEVSRLSLPLTITIHPQALAVFTPRT